MMNLYPCFDYLKNYDNIWVYADPHFGDADMVHLRRNNVSDNEQVRRINSKVGKKDVIIILGDVGDVSFVKKIKGYKILVVGNHDKGKTYYEKGDNDKKYLFDEVYDGVLTINDKIILSHEPVDIPFMFNIHGHDHSCFKYLNDGLHLNVCAEWIDFTPINLNQLIKKGTFKNVPNIHRIAIDSVIKEKERRRLYEEWAMEEPSWKEVYTSTDKIGSRFYSNGYECKCYGYITYKGSIYPLYSDSYGCQDFIVYKYKDKLGRTEEYEIQVKNMAGMLDWWFELSRAKYEYGNEIIQSLNELIKNNS